MLHYNHRTGDGMNAAQRGYRRGREQLRAANMFRLARVLIRPDALFSSPEENEVSVISVRDVTATVVMDVPRAGELPNSRMYQTGKLVVSENEAMPWRPRLSLQVDTACDLAAGIACRVQASRDVTTDDTILSPRAGTAWLRGDGNSVFVCVGNYSVDNEIRPFRVVRLATQDLQHVRIGGQRPGSLIGIPGTLRMGPMQKGSPLVRFDRPLKVEIANLGLGNEPLMRDNLSHAVPAQHARAMFKTAASIVDQADAKGVCCSGGFSVMQAGYLDDLEADGVSGTQWDNRQASLLGAGKHLGFAKPVEILFPGNGVIKEIVAGDRGKRVCLVMEDGTEYSYPSDAILTASTGHCSRYTPIGVWTTPAGHAIRPDRLSHEDVLSLLWDAAQQQGHVCEVGDKMCLMAPQGLLGSLAIQGEEENGVSDHYLSFSADLWNEKLGGFLLPSESFEQDFWLGNAQFETLVGVAAESGTRPARRQLISRRR